MFTPNQPVQSLFNQSGIQRSKKINGLLIEEVSGGRLSGQLTCFINQITSVTDLWNFVLEGQLLTSVNFPNLISTTDFSLDFTENHIETVTFPELTTFGANVVIDLGGNAEMSSIFFPKLATIGANFTLYCNNPILSVVSMPSVTSVAAGANIGFHGSSLTVESVNEILVSLNRGVGTNTCVVDVGGGTSAAPTGAGLVAKNALVARGWGVTTN